MFEVRFPSTQRIPGSDPLSAELIFDLDYGDGLARPDLALAVYEARFVPSVIGRETAAGDLIYHSNQGGGPDDRPAPLQGNDLDDLSRGSVGPLDPFVGPVLLEEGYYLLQISTSALQPAERSQYSDRLPTNPYARFEPITGITRVAEDRIDKSTTDQGKPSTADPPLIPVVLDPVKAPVPFNLGDVELFVSTSNEIYSVDPFTGKREVSFGRMLGVGAGSRRNRTDHWRLRFT